MPQDPRVVFTVSPEKKEKLDSLPWGMKAALMRRLADWVLQLYDKHGEMALGIILSEEFNLVSVLGDEIDSKKKGKKGGQA